MRVSVIAAIAVVLAAFLGAMLSTFGPQSKLDDDRVYLYAANFTITAPDEYRAQVDGWHERLAQAGYGAETLARYDFRAEYATNYVAQSAAIAAARTVWPWRASSLDHPDWMRATVVASGLALVGFGLLITCLMLAGLPAELRLGALFGLVGMAALAFLPVLSFYRISTDLDLLYPLRALTMLVQPGHELTPFGIQNRNVATLLVAAAVFARWRQKTAAVYWIVFAAGTMHATYGALILLMMLGLDVLLDPRRLWRPAVLAPIAAAAAWAAVFGVSFGTLIPPLMARLLFLGLLGGLLVLGMLPLDRLAPIRALRRLSPRVGEVAALSAAVIGLLAVVAAAASLTSGLERTYIVDELSGRPLGLLRVPLLLALAAIVTAALPERARRLAFVAAVIGSVASMPVGLLLLKMRHKPTPTAAEMLAHLPVAAAHGAQADSDTERAVYYSIARAMDSAGGGPRP